MTLAASTEIVVGIDGSESSIAALRSAQQMAEALHRPVKAVAAWQWPYMYDTAGAIGWNPDRDARASAEGAIATVYGEPDAIPLEIVNGPAAPALIEASRAASMLVVGSRGRGGFAGLLLGSVSAACAEHAHCPVLVVRQEPQR
jgi:nucleotide-binding universal stress UspA family protein